MNNNEIMNNEVVEATERGYRERWLEQGRKRLLRVSA